MSLVRLAAVGASVLALCGVSPRTRIEGGVGSVGASSRPTPVDFVRDVRPILSNHCFACHGPDADSRKAGLSLVTFEDATKPLSGGARPIVPGEPEESEVWRRINDADDPMPPAEEHDALSREQIETIGRWIREGASYAPHWAYVTPERAPSPNVKDAAWPWTDLDRHVLSRLEREGLTPAPDADPVTFVRRMTFDLLGLPPTPAEIDAYASDRAAGAAGRLADRLLASPHFGERMAMAWLDLVRFADTCGYHGDQDHNVWPYRDYVIAAFNKNKPFDRFTVEQLAGDLLPNPTQEQLVATAYNRLLQTSHEGGVQLKEYRAIYMADRVRNVSETWMGATVGCAQCHDHKYDPYTAKDFHAMGAFFADVDDEEHLRNQYGGLNTLPTRRLPQMPVRSDALAAELAGVDELIATAVAREAEVVAGLSSDRARWEEALLLDAKRARSRDVLWVDDALNVRGKTQGTFRFKRQKGIAPHRGETYRVQAAGGLTQHYVHESPDAHEVAEGDVFFAWVRLDPKRRPKAVMLQFNTEGDWTHRALWGNDAITYGRRGASWVGYRRKGKLPSAGRWVRLEVPASEVGLEPGQKLTGMAFTQFGGRVLWDEAGITTGQAAPGAVLDALAVAPAKRSAAQDKALREHQIKTSPAVMKARDALRALRARRQRVEKSAPIVMYTKALETPRVVRMLPRGNWLDESGEVVAPAVPAFLGELGIGARRATRLDFARWLVRPRSEGGVGELTARVFVNRIWALLFGEGLCPSTEDFGGQGVPPTHLALLDHLALDFVASGWDVKALVKRLVTTRTYGLSSIPSADAQRRDPTNLFYARQARRRLPAESVRDTLLAVSGLLVRDIGGPSVKPPQPPGYYRHLNFPTRRYKEDNGETQWRRGVYMHWQRQYVHPMLKAFDAPTREECTARRPVSNTPLAALALLNDPVFVEASRAFAARLLALDLPDDAARLRAGFRMATGRRASEEEIGVLTSLLAASRTRYAADAAAVEALLSVGETDRPVGADPVMLAAWTQAARALLNLHETITRE